MNALEATHAKIEELERDLKARGFLVENPICAWQLEWEDIFWRRGLQILERAYRLKAVES